MKAKLFATVLIACSLSGCAAISTLMSHFGSSSSSGLSVNAHIGHNKTNVGGNHSQIENNSGTAISGNSNNIKSAHNVTIENLADRHLLAYSLIIFLFGFLVGWPISGTPQSAVKRIFGSKNEH